MEIAQEKMRGYKEKLENLVEEKKKAQLAYNDMIWDNKYDIKNNKD